MNKIRYEVAGIRVNSLDEAKQYARDYITKREAVKNEYDISRLILDENNTIVESEFIMMVEGLL